MQFHTRSEGRSLPARGLKYARCQFCGETFDTVISETNEACSKCAIIEIYDPNDPQQYFQAVNRVTELVLKKAFNVRYKDPYYYLDTWGSVEGRKGFDVIARSIASVRKKELQNNRIVIQIKDIIPTKEICEGFKNLCTNKSVQDAVDMLCRYYRIPTMKTIFYEIVSSDKICKNARAVYYTAELTAYFDKTGYSQQTILHEFYHHLVNAGIAYASTDEEEEALADEYATQFTEKWLKE